MQNLSIAFLGGVAHLDWIRLAKSGEREKRKEKREKREERRRIEVRYLRQHTFGRLVPNSINRETPNLVALLYFSDSLSPGLKLYPQLGAYICIIVRTARLQWINSFWGVDVFAFFSLFFFNFFGERKGAWGLLCDGKKVGGFGGRKGDRGCLDWIGLGCQGVR